MYIEDQIYGSFLVLEIVLIVISDVLKGLKIPLMRIPGHTLDIEDQLYGSFLVFKIVPSDQRRQL